MFKILSPLPWRPYEEPESGGWLDLLLDWGEKLWPYTRLLIIPAIFAFLYNLYGLSPSFLNTLLWAACGVPVSLGLLYVLSCKPPR